MLLADSAVETVEVVEAAGVVGLVEAAAGDKPVAELAELGLRAIVEKRAELAAVCRSVEAEAVPPLAAEPALPSPVGQVQFEQRPFQPSQYPNHYAIGFV